MTTSSWEVSFVTYDIKYQDDDHISAKIKKDKDMSRKTVNIAAAFCSWESLGIHQMMIPEIMLSDSLFRIIVIPKGWQNPAVSALCMNEGEGTYNEKSAGAVYFHVLQYVYRSYRYSIKRV